MQHREGPAEFVTLIDYLAGKQSGIYRKNSPMQSPPPTTNILDLLQTVTPSFASAYTKLPEAVQMRKSAIYLQDILNIFEPRERYQQDESLTQSMTREFGLELARESARTIVNLQRQQPLTAAFMRLKMPTPYSFCYSLNQTGNKTDIFGFRSHICSKCLVKEHLVVSYPEDKQGGGRVEVKHSCKPDLIGLNQNVDDKSRASRVELLRETLPRDLKDIVNIWTGKKWYL